MKLFGSDNQEMMQVSKLELEGNQLVIRGKIYGTMPLVAILRPEEVRSALPLLNWAVIWFMVKSVLWGRKKKR